MSGGDEQEAERAPDRGAERSGPEWERLAEAERAFEVGDFRRLRRVTAALSDAAEPEVAEAARSMRARLALDPAIAGFLALCAVFFVAIAWKYLG